jgi:hypothetical protein
MAESNERLKAWFEHRVRAIHDKVTVYDILRRNGVSLKHSTDRIEQISCPFHGKDENPSARIYPGDAKSPAHIWCFVCRERWDAISLWKKFGGDETKKFHQVLSEMEKTFGITPPSISNEAFTQGLPQDSRVQENFERLYRACEERLLSVRDDYKSFDDMIGYLTVGSVLDKITFGITEGKISFQVGCDLLSQLRQRIAERIRKGHESTSSSSNP